MSALHITLPEYERIFRVVHSVYESTIEVGAKPSCLFYNHAAALILTKVHGIKAVPVCGGAVFRVSKEGPVLAFAHVDNQAGTYSTDDLAFHCWVETEKCILDFTAPVYGQYFNGVEGMPHIPRKMFQKTGAQMASSPWEIASEGDFFMFHDIEMGRRQTSKLNTESGTTDLLEACLEWYRRPPKTLPPAPTLIDNFGVIESIRLDRKPLIGAW